MSWVMMLCHLGKFHELSLSHGFQCALDCILLEEDPGIIKRELADVMTWTDKIIG